MVKRSGLPGRGSVAGRTVLAQAALVRVSIGVAGITVAGRTLKDAVDMATRTGGGSVRTRQLED